MNRIADTATVRRRARGFRVAPPVLLFAAPAVVLLVAFYLVPVGVILARSVTDIPDGTHSHWENFRWFFENDVNLVVLRRTIVTSLLITGLCVVLAYPYAFQMTRVSPRMRRVLLAAVIIPLFTSTLVRNFAWVVILRPDGALNWLLGNLGLGHAELLGTTTAVVIGMTQIMLPIMVLSLYTAMREIDPRLLQASAALGGSAWATFRRVHLPLTSPGVVAGSLLVFVLSLGFYITPAFLGSPDNNLLSYLIVRQLQNTLAWGRAAVLAITLLVSAGIILGLGAMLRSRTQLARSLRAETR